MSHRPPPVRVARGGRPRRAARLGAGGDGQRRRRRRGPSARRRSGPPRPLRRDRADGTEFYVGALPDRITLFRSTIEAEAGEDDEELRAQVAETVVHEVAHHFGISTSGSRPWGGTDGRAGRRARDAARADGGPDVPRARRRRSAPRSREATTCSPRWGTDASSTGTRPRTRRSWPCAPPPRPSVRGGSMGARHGDPRTVRDVCRRSRPRPARPGGVRSGRSEGGIRRIAREPPRCIRG